MIKRTIITYGTFDLFHIGHLRLLQRLKKLGTKLIVAVSTDEFNNLKGKQTVIPFEERIEIVKNIKGVDMLIAEKNWEQKINDIEKYDIDIFAIGDNRYGKFNDFEKFCEVLYLKRTAGISSSQLKQNIKKSEIKETSK
jgi:glycerol-3-phosphate cytidylyltransferase